MAIIMVLMSHGRHFLIPAWETAAVFRIGGFLGVELFFVLSGFLIGNIVWSSFNRAGPHRAWVLGFIARRGLRTLPSYYLFLLVNVLLISNAVVPGHVGDLLPFMVFVQNLAWPHPLVFGEAWSLAVEEIFYLILPLCLVLSSLIFSNRRIALFSAATLLLLLPLAARIIAVELSDPLWDSGIRKVVVFRLDSLMVGVLASWLARVSGTQPHQDSSCFGLGRIGYWRSRNCIFSEREDSKHQYIYTCLVVSDGFYRICSVANAWPHMDPGASNNRQAGGDSCTLVLCALSGSYAGIPHHPVVTEECCSGKSP
ncbi:acyltransferase [Polaromonas sp. P1-6]|nr:acyltransferase [Polaromonas sp. P1-6]